MHKEIFTLLLACIFVFLLFTSCQKDSSPSSSDENTGSGGSSGTTVTNALSENSSDHQDDADYVWNSSDVIPIVLNGNSITENTDNATVSGSTITISSAGTYSFSGSLSNGQIIVDTQDQTTVRLILNGVDLNCSTSSPIYVKTSKKVILVLADNTTNKVTDGSSYVFANTTDTEPNAAIFSTADFTIYGNGSLIVDGNYNDGIASKDGLIIKSGTISVTSVDDGIRGKDYLVVKDGNITVNSFGDGFKSDNSEDTQKGYVLIESGTISITSSLDAITAETDVLISNGEINLTSGGGSSKTISNSSTISAKGIKGVASVVVDNGYLSVSSADDAFHSNGAITINGGTFGISSGDDGIHADSILAINGGTIAITKCYEGIESKDITINDGNINLVSSDDGVNGAGGNDGSGTAGWTNGVSSGSYNLYINGGYIAVYATGDGIDVNGAITMTSGIVIVHGPTSSGNGPLDYDTSFKISGGFLLAVGSSGMAQAPSTSSTQYSTMFTLKSTQSANTIFHIQKNDGTEVLSFKPSKKYQSVVFSAPALSNGSSYDVYLGGSSTGTETDGLYSGGTYTAGTKSTSFTISNILTSLSL
jgi:hypothetical protein